MFDVGFAELFLLALIGLLVLGPERLPAVARTLGGFIRKARLSWISLRNTIESELAEADIAAPLKEAGEELKRIGKEISDDLPDFTDIPGFNPKDHITTGHEHEETDSGQEESPDESPNENPDNENPDTHNEPESPETEPDTHVSPDTHNDNGQDRDA